MFLVVCFVGNVVCPVVAYKSNAFVCCLWRSYVCFLDVVCRAVCVRWWGVFWVTYLVVTHMRFVFIFGRCRIGAGVASAYRRRVTLPHIKGSG